MLSQPPKDGAMYGIFSESTNFMVVSKSPLICKVEQYTGLSIHLHLHTVGNKVKLMKMRYQRKNCQKCLPQNWRHHQNQSFASWQVRVQDDLTSQDNRRAPPAKDLWYYQFALYSRLERLKQKTKWNIMICPETNCCISHLRMCL